MYGWWIDKAESWASNFPTRAWNSASDSTSSCCHSGRSHWLWQNDSGSVSFQYEISIVERINDAIVDGGVGDFFQVPQFIFDEAIRHRKNCNIVICQPRRVAAESNAARVAVERNWPLSTVVGYQVGLDQRTNQSDDTRILFCTTGVMLEKLIRSAKKDNPLAEYTHVILDEVHERDKNMDFLFIVLKKLINPRVKIILMSATINARDVCYSCWLRRFYFSCFLISACAFQFSEYFSMPINGRFKPAPVISINRKNKYTVETYYLDDLEYLNRKLNPNFQVCPMPTLWTYNISHIVVRKHSIDFLRSAITSSISMHQQSMTKCTIGLCDWSSYSNAWTGRRMRKAIIRMKTTINRRNRQYWYSCRALMRSIRCTDTWKNGKSCELSECSFVPSWFCWTIIFSICDSVTEIVRQIS